MLPDSQRESLIPKLHIAVRDTGQGNSAQERKNLFQKFSQADSSISRKYGGAGLGLSITKHLTELMGGTIGVESEKGQGSTFWFEIPYKAAETEGEAPVSEAAADQNRKMNILLVEDNHVNQLISTRLLEKKGHRVTLASNGESALRALQGESFDLILMDLNLPIKSGIETTREIKDMGPPFRDIPVIALTANTLEDQIRKCYEVGMVDHIIKPFSPQTLYKVLSRYAPKSPSQTAENLSMTAVADNIGGKMQAIEEEFGPDYMDYLIRSGVSEIENLLAQVRDAAAQRDYNALYRAIHDMKSVSGSIGLAGIHELARTIEARCLDNKYEDIETLLERLEQDCRREISRLTQSIH
jgi:CheY-like chemotaxis protein/HPt (histidine-containing phosphotransfer) domain-containing protein